jgi:hypothetical protein
MRPNDSFAEPLTFPNPEAGFMTNETGTLVAPGFGRKKDAKQYAAKSCIQWLMKSKYMPSDGIHVDFPRGSKPTPTPASAPKTQTNPPKPTTTTTTTTTATTSRDPVHNADNNNADNNNADNNNADNNNADNDKDKDDDDSMEPATKRVEDLCRVMGLTIPRYKITASPTADAAAPNTDFFEGHADFGSDAIQVPEGLGQVSNVYGRRNARERIAEEVLVWLVDEEKKRLKEVDEMMAQVGEEGGK